MVHPAVPGSRGGPGDGGECAHPGAAHDAEPPAELEPTAAERSMWQAFRNGTVCDLRAGDQEQDDTAGPYPWGPERAVRARLVALLLLDGPPGLPGRVAALKLRGALVTGALDLSGGTVEPYVELRDCRFEHEVLLPECRFTTLRMTGCLIPRLEAARLTTEGDLHLPRCTVPGGMRLTDAHIGTDLLLNQLTVHPDRRGRSIAADGLSVAQDLQAEMLESRGEISLRGAQVGVSFSMRGSRLSNPYGRALNAPQLTVARSLYLTSIGLSGMLFGGATPPYSISATPAQGTRVQRFECEGGIRLDDGRFGDAADFYQARFVMEPDQELSLRRIQTPELRFLGERPRAGRVVLSGAKVGNLVDRSTSWPAPGGLAMAGFTYEALIPRGNFPLPKRLEWVAAATPEYAPGPYEQLAHVLRACGEDAEAREVLLAKHRRRRETLPPAGKLWGYLQDLTVAYGYRPGQAALWMAVLWAVGTLLFAQNRPSPLKEGEEPHWDAALYVLDLLLPVIDLGQAGAWRPGGGYQWAAAAMIILGWILATTVAAGASRVLRRN
ncbi:oxidoreductase [Streptomyces meridianus]|uniref:Oxidoreductase n=1 Tax=Streptomyces meridianus TaxID=2938945 RepID=A0ABT0X1R0_9ACTN|nr:oxidoreductase [Streptomyces meridianus]MCM2576489.1 oxidoreductase [Streptomyces meridianus]